MQVMKGLYSISSARHLMMDKVCQTICITRGVRTRGIF